MEEGVILIDCQVYTEYLESLGARMIDGKEFRKLIKESIKGTLWELIFVALPPTPRVKRGEKMDF